MPRTARASVGGVCYHVLNRGNARNDVFHKDEDFEAFLKLIGEACERLPMRVLGWCLLSNHFHMVLWPREDGDLSRWMQWLLTSHVRRYHRHYHSSGHVWQGRFKAFPIQQDGGGKGVRNLWSVFALKVPDTNGAVGPKALLPAGFTSPPARDLQGVILWDVPRRRRRIVTEHRHTANRNNARTASIVRAWPLCVERKQFNPSR